MSPLPTNRAVWPHTDSATAQQHIDDHNALAAAVNALEAAVAALQAVDPLTAAEHGLVDHTGLTGILGGGGGGGTSGGVIRKTQAQTLTATAQTAVADASFPVEANSKYYFMMNVNVTTSSGSSPTSAFGFTGPAGATVAISEEQDTSTSVETSSVITSFTAFAAGAQVANTGARFMGVVETGATAGTVQLTCARAGTNPSMVIPIGGVQGFWVKMV